MMRVNSVKFSKYILTIILFSIAIGCNAQQTSRKAGRASVGQNMTEELLNAEEGSWAVQEEDSDKTLMDPLEAHMRARRMVNPNETSVNRTYTSRKDAEEMNNEHHYRVMKLTPGTMQATRSTEEEAPEESAPQIADDQNFTAPIPGIKPVFAEAEKPAEEKTEETVVASIADETPVNAPIPNRKPKPVFSPSRGLKTDSIGSVPLPPRKEEMHAEEERKEEIVYNDPPKKSKSEDIMHIEGVRIGEHPGKTRIVLDTDGPVEYSYDTDNKTLQIDFDNATWDTQSLKKYSDHSLLKGYKAETGDSYSRMTFSLTKPAKVLSSQHFSPENGNKNHRIVIDIAPL